MGSELFWEEVFSQACHSFNQGLPFPMYCPIHSRKVVMESAFWYEPTQGSPYRHSGRASGFVPWPSLVGLCLSTFAFCGNISVENKNLAGMVAHTYSPSPLEVEQEDQEVKASLSYMGPCCHKKRKRKKTNNTRPVSDSIEFH